MTLLASAIGALSGVVSMGMVALIAYRLRLTDTSTLLLVGLFAGLCVVTLLTRIGSQMVLCKLTQTTVSRMRLGLCRRIMESPLRQLEEIGAHRMLNAITGDVGTVVQAMNGVPILIVNVVILVCGAIFLGWQSIGLLMGALFFCALGIGAYVFAARFAKKYVDRSRQAQDALMKDIRWVIEGVKELKMHSRRRREFDEALVSGEMSLRQNKFAGDSLNDAAISLGRLMFFVALGMLLFVWPMVRHVDTATMTAYALTIMYLMGPLEQIVGWLPFLMWASSCVEQIERLGLMLDGGSLEPARLAPAATHWERIELDGVTHSYKREGREHGFVLGPIDLTLRPGEIVFIVGGNGSGKTTLAKLIVGLYVPECGEIRLDGQLVSAESREAYRQLFAAVFDDAVIFESLWGLGAADLDRRAREYLRLLEIEHVVSVTDGVFSTTSVSRGQRKRLALLTAYLEDRPIYLFDEWAADQDPVFKKLFYLRLLPELKRQGKAVVAVTHDDRYFEHADRIIKLDEGKGVVALQHEVPAETDRAAEGEVLL
jgi:putative ATP-binding cassette transporter